MHIFYSNKFKFFYVFIHMHNGIEWTITLSIKKNISIFLAIISRNEEF